MAGNVIQITVGGQVAPSLGASASAAANSLSGVGQAANAAGASLQRLPPAIAPAGRGLGQVGRDALGAASGLNAIPPAAGPAGRGLNQTAVAANNTAAALARTRAAAGGGSVALNDFSRIVQDAPFGIVGIGNNITQLVYSFGNLRATAGSTGAAFRQLFTSAAGFGGISLILSAITTAVTFASVGFGAWTRGIGSNKAAIDDAKKATEEFGKSLKSVSEIAGQATGGVQGQIAQVRALADVVTNTNNTYEQRKRALQELQQVNKSYFGDLKLEENQMGILSARVNEYTQALVQQAVVKGFESEIGKVSTGLYDQEKALSRAENAYKRLRSELDNTKQTLTSATGEERVNARFIELTNSTEEARKAFAEQRDVVEKGRSSFIDLSGAMQRAVAEGLKFKDLSNPEGDQKDVDLLKQRIDALKELQSLTGLDTSQRVQLAQLEIQLARRDSIKAGFTADELQQQIDGIIEKAFPVKTFEFKLSKVAIVPGTVELGSNIDVAGSVLTEGAIPDDAFDGVINKIRENANAKFFELGESVRQSLISTLASSIVEGMMEGANLIGQAVGDIFSGGNLGQAIARAGEGFLSIVGGILQDIGKQAIITSLLVEKLKIALSGLFGPGGGQIGVAAGLALIAAGGLLKSFKFNVGNKFADGVTGFSGGLAMVGERGPEVVRLPAGSDVIPNDRIGGGAIALAPSIRFSGTSFQIMLEQVDRQRRRMG